MTNKQIQIPIKIIHANQFFHRLKGLMFRKKPIHEEALWIDPCNSIHMFFMNFAIDVLFLDQQNRVVRKIEHLKPWRVASPVKGARSVLEMPLGSIQRYKIETGDTILMENVQ